MVKHLGTIHKLVPRKGSAAQATARVKNLTKGHATQKEHRQLQKALSRLEQAVNETRIR